MSSRSTLQGATTIPAADGGSLVAARYEVLGLVGVGGMASVYRVRDVKLGETVALKVLKKEIAALPDMVELFHREVKLARRVTHKNVARVYDIDESGDEHFITMELVDGASRVRAPSAKRSWCSWLARRARGWARRTRRG
jgi:serine/threonine protein kinase